jgi:diguanylate cyclase (GGDEF)-like protein
MKVLVAEDDLTTCTTLTALLEKWGYKTIAVADGRKAWELLQSVDAPKLIILDWNMPEMNGLEVCSRLRQAKTTNPPYIILLTSRHKKTDTVKGLDAGANDYVVKPFDSDELLARVRVAHKMLDLQSDLNKARDDLLYQAMHDQLTGIFNRRALLEILKKELSRAGREFRGLCVCMCDIDHFKLVNDKYGHKVGDEVLCGFISTMNNELREYDTIGRIGGEEFVILIPTPERQINKTLCERLCSSVANTEFFTSAGPISITVSIGVTSNTESDSVDSMLARADTALYRAKLEGRNRVAFSHNPK